MSAVACGSDTSVPEPTEDASAVDSGSKGESFDASDAGMTTDVASSVHTDTGSSELGDSNVSTDVSMSTDVPVVIEASMSMDATDATDASMVADATDATDASMVADASADAGTVCALDASCDDGNACTVDSCDPIAGCRHVDRSMCGEPNCSLGACAGVDTDGDGFSDAEEDADYIDLNCNGVHDAGDFDFPHRAQPVFGAVSHVGSGPGMMMPTVADPTSNIATSTIVVTVTTSGIFGDARITYAVNGGASSAPLEARPVTDIAGNVRLLFYASTVADFALTAGDTYTFTTAMGPSTKIADKNVPNIYVQYDYMDYPVHGDTYAVPGASCTTDHDCEQGGAEPNDVCHNGYCNHNHFPGDPLFRMVIDSFAKHGITLYIDPVHHAVPHARVVTWSRPGDGSSPNGAVTACAGADVVAGDITTRGAVNFHDIKNRTTFGGPFDAKRKNVFRYTVFGHLSTCLSDSPGPGYCGICPNDRATPQGQPQAGASGTSEIPGNDFIVSLGDTLNSAAGSSPDDPFLEGGVFMHELGHTLGLHHLGDVGGPAYAPNYLSVMNYSYALHGILHASMPGGTTSVEALRELDYSEHALNDLNEASLVESAGVSPLASGYTGIIFFYDGNGSYTYGPEAGSIDWNGNGTIDANPVAVDLNIYGGAVEKMSGYRDWDHPAANGGVCDVNTDCRVNFIRNLIHNFGGPGGNPDPLIDPHEPCVRGRCQSLAFGFQCFPWAQAD
jgi:hypothetical protein